jgi:hypothetical protein
VLGERNGERVTTNGRHPPEQELTASGRHYPAEAGAAGSAEPWSASATARA